MIRTRNAERGTRNEDPLPPPLGPASLPLQSNDTPAVPLSVPRSALRVPRSLNVPLVLAVETDTAGEPVVVTWKGRRRAVTAVIDRWRIDDEWWRAPISRLYRRLVLDGDLLLTVFEDLLTGRWYAQRYRFGRGAEQAGAGTRTREPRRAGGRLSRAAGDGG